MEFSDVFINSGVFRGPIQKNRKMFDFKTKIQFSHGTPLARLLVWSRLAPSVFLVKKSLGILLMEEIVRDSLNGSVGHCWPRKVSENQVYSGVFWRIPVFSAKSDRIFGISIEKCLRTKFQVLKL